MCAFGIMATYIKCLNSNADFGTTKGGRGPFKDEGARVPLKGFEVPPLVDRGEV